MPGAKRLEKLWQSPAQAGGAGVFAAHLLCMTNDRQGREKRHFDTPPGPCYAIFRKRMHFRRHGDSPPATMQNRFPALGPGMPRVSL